MRRVTGISATAVAISLLLLVGGCSSAGKEGVTRPTTTEITAISTSHVPSTSTTIGGSLVPSNQAQAESQGVHQLGDRIDLGEGISITLTNPVVSRNPSQPWSLKVTVHAENRGDTPAANPMVSLICGSTSDHSGAYNDSSYNTGAPLPEGSFSEGVINILRPGDNGTSAAAPKCGPPAYLRVYRVAAGDTSTFAEPVPGATIGNIAVPETVLDELNRG